MITHPSSRDLVETVRRELQQSVAPAIADERVLGLLGMLDSLLHRVSIRCEHEVAWMREEIAAIEQAAEEFVAAAPDRSASVADALDHLRAGRTASDNTADVAAEYRLASEILARGLEARDVPAQQRALFDQLLGARLAREAEVLGDFSLVARG